MKAPGASQTKDWAMAAAVAAVGYALYTFLMPAGPADPTEGEGGHVDPAPEDGRPATFTESEARRIADGIFAALYEFMEDEAEVVRLLCLCQVDADVRLVVNAYGERALNFAVFNARTLSQAVTMYLSAGDVADINNDYQSKGIRFRF